MSRRPNRKALTPHQRISKWITEGRLTEGAGGCWLWMGHLSDGGYGNVGMSDKAIGGDGSGRYRVAVHRFVYEYHVSPIPDGLDLDHLCRVRNCANPDHLEPVTRSENLRRAIGIGIQWSRRTSCSRGHEYTPENIRRSSSDGSRVCRTCERENRRKSDAKRRRRYMTRDQEAS